MKIIEGKEQEWKEVVEKNDDPYGACTIRFTIRWAELMESKLEKGEKLEDFYKAAGHEADTEGITGFMYGWAAGALARFWVHGEELRIAHNKSYGISEEESKANPEGTVNPAILTIG